MEGGGGGGSLLKNPSYDCKIPNSSFRIRYPPLSYGNVCDIGDMDIFLTAQTGSPNSSVVRALVR